jgi:hypothetical protein
MSLLILDEDLDVIPVPADGETRARLKRFAAAIGKPPVEAARVLLRDLLADEEFWNEADRAAMN